ncbi:Spo0B C-terminal domain-containing protein [Alteribacter populi]|uniref:Spo0B C-terminal domain-containing protein n=1 Tax=Alteribacter populi TaxID=2011011 RepID=UPI0018E23E1E|nr:Spo0B C-terminal domain-containing protein [Alteribacter populi]
MTKEWHPVELLRHYRHDWLNQMQLIKGNLSLGKTERVEVLLNEIIEQARNEARLSNTNGEHLAEYLLTFNWEHHNFHLNFEVVSEPRDLKAKQMRILNVIKRLFTWFDRHCYSGADNHLLFVMSEEDGIPVIDFDFQGKLNIEVLSLEELEEVVSVTEEVEIKEIEMGQTECFIRLHFHD